MLNTSTIEMLNWHHLEYRSVFLIYTFRCSVKYKIFKFIYEFIYSIHDRVTVMNHKICISESFINRQYIYCVFLTNYSLK